MGAKIGGNDDQPISEINVVPLVDIILVVLIIFMVTAPMIMKPSIDVNLPKAASGGETAPSKLNIAIQKSGKVTFNGKVSSNDQISKKVKEMVSKRPDVQAIISADRKVPHGKVIAIIDIVKLAGVTKFAISVDRK